MNYEYVTENNLVNRQNYMYSRYGGKSFITAYKELREQYIMPGKGNMKAENKNPESPICVRLDKLWKDLKIKALDSQIKYDLDKLVQSFEVRKRLYSEIDENWKPVNQAGKYNDMKAYLLFAQVLADAYEKRNNLKYLSCLLKVDDTLISIESFMEEDDRLVLSEILKKELGYVSDLSEKLAIRI